MVKINREIEIQREPENNKIRLVIYNGFHFYQKWKLSYGQYTHSGIRAWQTKENTKFKKHFILQKQ